MYNSLTRLFYDGHINEDQFSRYWKLTQQWEQEAAEEGWIGVGVISYVDERLDRLLKQEGISR